MSATIGGKMIARISSKMISRMPRAIVVTARGGFGSCQKLAIVEHSGGVARGAGEEARSQQLTFGLGGMGTLVAFALLSSRRKQGFAAENVLNLPATSDCPRHLF
jgi:hypothetical protein